MIGQFVIGVFMGEREQKTCNCIPNYSGIKRLQVAEGMLNAAMTLVKGKLEVQFPPCMRMSNKVKKGTGKEGVHNILGN